MIERTRRVVLLIDYDNLQICASRDTPGRDLQLAPVVQLAQRYGTVILARAYAEWNLSTERLTVYKAGIEPAFAPVLRTESDRSGKSLADTVMVAEGMDMLWTLSPEVVVLATSDKDLIPLVRVAKQRGAFVVVLGSDFTAIPLREMADEHVTYKQLITDSQGRYVTETGPARQAAALPEPARRRPTRERNGRDRTPVTPPAVAPSVAASPQPTREPQASAAAVQSAPGSTPPAEPVAPLTVGMSVDGDAQGLGRRRRRRGSRRRSERVGGVGEGILNSEGAPEGESSTAETTFAGLPLAELPLTEDSYIEGEGLFPEDPQAEESAALEADPSVVFEAPGAPDTRIATQSREPAAPEAEVATPASPPPLRNRRRSARRPPSVIAPADPGLLLSGAAVDEPVSAPPPAETPDILWAADPGPGNGTFVPADGEDAALGEPIAEEGRVAARPRSRRVSSASRGRTRPAPSR